MLAKAFQMTILANKFTRLSAFVLIDPNKVSHPEPVSRHVLSSHDLLMALIERVQIVDR
jgi:hypothetical protein